MAEDDDSLTVQAASSPVAAEAQVDEIDEASPSSSPLLQPPQKPTTSVHADERPSPDEDDSVQVDEIREEEVAPTAPVAKAVSPQLMKPPELIKPPDRRSPKATTPAAISSIGRPTPKRPQPVGKEGTPQRDAPQKPAARSLEIVRVRSESSERRKPAPGDEQTPSRAIPSEPRPSVELRRPHPRPNLAKDKGVDTQAPTDQDEDIAIDAVESPDTVLELRRPVPPRSTKRVKTRREEEEEEQESVRPKSATKTKRRLQNLIDDDEELDLDDALDNGASSAAPVSLSLMRPPKPKSGRQGQNKPTTAAPPSKVKKPSRESSRTSRRDRREQEVKQEKPEQITLTDSITVHDLADLMAIPETEIIRALFFKGIAANINQILDIPTATMVAEEMGITVEQGETAAEARKVTEMLDANDLENLERRPPVVTIMGHVDHGKTTLLDSIRKTKVAQGEAGGITQHIGAYHVDVEHEGEVQQVVFLDTPGHEAFTAMRARGARVTDIAVLVVAADDGVRPQTIEAISHAKAAEVPIVVAINKIDKEEAQPDRVKQELTEYGLVPEEWGGETIMVPVSAIKGENLDTLLEMLLLVAEVEDLYANPNRPAKGTVIEANLDKSRGPVATLLIQNGTLRVGDTLVAGSAFCKVRAMVDDRGRRVDEAYPSFAVEVLGLSDVPAAGDDFEVFRDEKQARALASNRSDHQRLSRLQQAMASRRVTLNTLSVQAQEGDLKELNLILKSDVQGSLEAILNALQQLPQKEVQIRVLLAAPGEVTETDVDLAAASSAVIVGFNTTLASGARQAADNAGVDIREYTIIYKLLEDIQGAMEGLLDPEMVEEALGQVEVRAVFPVGKGAVAGCYVQSGKAIRNCRLRVVRGGEVIYTGNLDSLKRMKEDTKEVNAGYECGIGVDNFNTWKEGDIIETFKLVSKRRTLSA
jgi:translation initiation factor IF-2